MFFLQDFSEFLSSFINQLKCEFVHVSTTLLRLNNFPIQIDFDDAENRADIEMQLQKCREVVFLY
jgi:hypothetical protein